MKKRGQAWRRAPLFCFTLYSFKNSYMNFKRFKRKGLIFNNNSIGLGLEVRIGKKIKVFRVERLTKEDKTFEFLIYDGPELLKGVLKQEVVTFFETHDEQYSFFDGELKTWKKIK